MPEQRILITGAAGLLGRYCTSWFRRRHEVFPLSRKELDITDARAVLRLMAELRPSLVINCAAMASVDACETDPEQARNLNAAGPLTLAKACRDVGAILVHVSTDFVFDGKKSEPYTFQDEPNPRSRYGQSKLEGEELVRQTWEKQFIVRSSRIFGQGGRNFLSTVISVARRDGKVRGIIDEVSIPTYAQDLAERIEEVVHRGRFGTYHLTNQGACSWFDIGKEALKQAGLQTVEVEPVRSADLKRPAHRPVYSAMRCLLSEDLGLPPLRDWRQAFQEFLRAGEVK